MLMWEEAAIKDDVIEYDIAFNIIYIMRTHIAVAKLRCPSLTKYRHVRATVSPQRSLLSKDETHDGIRNGVFLNERCKPTQDPSGCHRPQPRPGLAAEMLGITPRHCSRLLKRYRQSGPLGMNNQSRGRTGNRLLSASLTDQALNIIRERYANFGPTLTWEKLAENHGLLMSL